MGRRQMDVVLGTDDAVAVKARLYRTLDEAIEDKERLDQPCVCYGKGTGKWLPRTTPRSIGAQNPGSNPPRPSLQRATSSIVARFGFSKSDLSRDARST
jgi:hypothetical protein